MTRFLPRFGNLTNVNIQADLEAIGPKLVINFSIAADVPTPSGKKRFLSEQRVDLQNFLDGCAKESGLLPEPAVCSVCGRTAENACYSEANIKADGGRNPHCPMRRA